MQTLQRSILAVVVFMLIAAAMFAQSNPPQNGACFFKETGYRGTNFCAQAGESLENLPSGFNDAIRSVRIYGNAQVTIFSDNRLAGASTVLRSDVPDLRMMQVPTDVTRNWSERISSAQITRTGDWGYQWGRGQPFGGVGACFFEDTNFRGRSFCVERGKALENLPSGFNDRIRSIRVMGDSEVQMFNDNNFGGAAARTRRDVPDLGVWRIPDDPTRNWSGRISSLRVGAPRSGRWDNTGGYRDRDDDDDRGDYRNLVRCASQPGERQQYCNARGYVREAYMINSYGTCRKGITWGVDDGRLWVSNGCSADFQVGR